MLLFSSDRLCICLPLSYARNAFWWVPWLRTHCKFRCQNIRIATLFVVVYVPTAVDLFILYFLSASFLKLKTQAGAGKKRNVWIYRQKPSNVKCAFVYLAETFHAFVSLTSTNLNDYAYAMRDLNLNFFCWWHKFLMFLSSRFLLLMSTRWKRSEHDRSHFNWENISALTTPFCHWICSI